MIAILIAIWLIGAVCLGAYLVRTWGNSAADEKAVLIVGVAFWWFVAALFLLCATYDLILVVWRKRKLRT